MQKSKFAKFEISKIANLKNQNLEKLSSQFFPRDRSRNYLLEIAFLFLRSATRHSLLRLLVLHWQCARCKLNASKQCPYEATTSTRLNSHGSEQPQEQTSRTKEPVPIREAAFASLKAPLRPVPAPVDPTDESEGREASGQRTFLRYGGRKTTARQARSW
jgi:hypothetical protein